MQTAGNETRKQLDWSNDDEDGSLLSINHTLTVKASLATPYGSIRHGDHNMQGFASADPAPSRVQRVLLAASRVCLSRVNTSSPISLLISFLLSLFSLLHSTFLLPLAHPIDVDLHCCCCLSPFLNIPEHAFTRKRLERYAEATTEC